MTKSATEQRGEGGVSVVITCFDQARFLPEAIESVLRQTCAPKETVVVDDGSTDDTWGVATRYSGVRYVRQKRGGLAAARNTGIRETTGSYLVFLDADDRLLPRGIEHNLTCFRAHPECALVFGARFRIAADGSRLNRPRKVPIENEHYLALLRGNFIGMHGTVMYRRDILESIQGFDTSLEACEDYDLYLRIARIHPIWQHDEAIAEYRRHDAAMSSNPAMMLQAAQTALRSQRTHIEADPRYREAYEDGMKTWREFYGRKLFLQALRDGAKGELRGATNAALALGRYAGLTTVLRQAPFWVGEVALGCLKSCTSSVAKFAPAKVLTVLRGYRRRLSRHPPVGWVRFGDVRRIEPIGRQTAYVRDAPIDRYYIESFLSQYAKDIRGRVLETGGSVYTRRFGGARVTESDVLHLKKGGSRASIVADLSSANYFDAASFDAIVLTHTLHLVYDLPGALRTLHRILREGGVVLATLPGVSGAKRSDAEEESCWGFTQLAARRLFEADFSSNQVKVKVHGNVRLAIAHLHGLRVPDLYPRDLNYRDREYPVVITVRAQKAPDESHV